ncbi:hypothetical protein PUNSTDRAFT_49180 [Punctularia strigosozonata HHB-11173 SS5]|uniref:uncharacterized protein n=1 Tax=Punctularia strigosozonata (strain HHB-11173) TaxID=741275 RepID=UPI00044182EF|nr:uncharacterized protein PUNSTDRAFT_49180 [Punctularia strigosozonata HHB-11173 SS5]EIN14361.1 hypothetical protein PUNSTDRAFT_49180 [Punctularia strigosozonata HHB-11173 SS5]
MKDEKGLTDLITPDTRIKVSSTLDKSVGKIYLTDGSPETCWTSREGSSQYIQLTFSSPVRPKRIVLTFQGGFVGKTCIIEALPSTGTEGDRLLPVARIYPEDVNREQAFELPENIDISGSGVSQIKLTFEESSDFFGRVTVYNLRIQGDVL